MGLLVWLPLITNTENQGLSDVLVTSNGATSNSTNGKIADSCYYFNGSAQYLQLSKSLGTFYNDDFSWSVWLKPTDSTRGVISSEYSSSGASNVALELSADLRPRIHWNGSPDIFTPSGDTTKKLKQDVWNHLAVCKSTNKIDIYIDGNLIYTYTGTLSTRPTASIIRIGDDYRGGTSVSYMGYMQDFRIYNHCLSAKEVREISRGLICHYKFDDPNNSFNLLENGFGEYDGDNWANSGNRSLSEIPTTTPQCKNSYFNNHTNKYIPIFPGHQYTFSAYIKQKGSATTTIYPYLFHCDYDKKQIHYFNARIGFNAATKTTLVQPLKKGDTVIHAADLSAWTTADNYYYHVAIFSYSDGSGYVYPDLEYTADSPVFGTRTDKSHIDKANNTITLNSPFTGEDRPSGTTICQATEGSSYWYPFGAVSPPQVSNWTFKTKTWTPKDDTYMTSAVRYIRYFSTYGDGVLFAGIKLTDDTADDTHILYDCSGYRRNGTFSGYPTINQNSPRNSYAMSFYYGAKANVGNLPTPTVYTYAWWGYCTNSSNNMMWGYSDGNRLNLYLNGNKFFWNTGDGAGNPFNVSATPYMNSWHHYAVTGDGTSSKLYIDGVHVGTSTTYRSPTGTGLWFNGWNSAATYSENGLLSDFRFYATCLSDADILELYNIPVSITNTGSIVTQGEFMEDFAKSGVSVASTAIVATSQELTYRDSNTVSFAKSGSLYSKDIIES